MAKQVLDNGEYLIFNGTNILSNFPTGTWTPPFISPITPGSFAGNRSKWVIKHVNEGAYSIVNVDTGHKAWVSKQVLDARVYANSDEGTHFAIESAGANEFIVKVVNDNLEWTVVNEGSLQVVLHRAGEGASQHFRFEYLGPVPSK